MAVYDAGDSGEGGFLGLVVGFARGVGFDTELGDVFREFGLSSYVERLRM